MCVVTSDWTLTAAHPHTGLVRSGAGLFSLDIAKNQMWGLNITTGIWSLKSHIKAVRNTCSITWISAEMSSWMALFALKDHFISCLFCISTCGSFCSHYVLIRVWKLWKVTSSKRTSWAHMTIFVWWKAWVDDGFCFELRFVYRQESCICFFSWKTICKCSLKTNWEHMAARCELQSVSETQHQRIRIL